VGSWKCIKWLLWKEKGADKIIFRISKCQLLWGTFIELVMDRAPAVIGFVRDRAEAMILFVRGGAAVVILFVRRGAAAMISFVWGRASVMTGKSNGAGAI
jgi:hypothetical protein